MLGVRVMVAPQEYEFPRAPKPTVLMLGTSIHSVGVTLHTDYSATGR